MRIAPVALICLSTLIISCKKEQQSAVSNQTQLAGETVSGRLQLHAGMYKNVLAKQFTLRWTTNRQTLTYNPRVIGLGSSTLAGYGLEYPDRLGDKIVSWLIHNTYKPYWVNKAVYGNNSVKTLPVALGGTSGQNIETALSFNPDFIFISLPSNDAASSIPVNVTLANFRKIDSFALSKGVPVFFETTQPRNSININVQVQLKQLADSIRKIWPVRYVEGFNKVVDKNAPTPAAIMPKYDHGDGIHLTAEGNQFIANSLFKTLQNYFVPVTGVAKYIIQTSADKISWKEFDVIANGNIVKKTYNMGSSFNYYRVQAVYNNGTRSTFSNIVY